MIMPLQRCILTRKPNETTETVVSALTLLDTSLGGTWRRYYDYGIGEKTEAVSLICSAKEFLYNA
jgi:hypothetical protein